MNWFKRIGKRKDDSRQVAPVIEATPSAVTQVSTLEVEISPGDPFLAYILNSPGVVDVEKIKLDSDIVQQLKGTGVKLVVPLVSQGELIGLLNLGPRLSEADYSSDDLRLLSNLATQAAPALRVAQLARQQQIEARERERMEQELRVARVIQQTLLPKEVPSIPGYQMAAHWQPARAVSGDFYDFIRFPDGKLAIIAGDVTDKGVPAALVMAATRSILRSAAERYIDPGDVLEHANNMLCPDIPPNMFVTCLYALLDPETGMISYANAGHNLPFQRKAGELVEIRARGMPLGLMPDVPYEVKATNLGYGENVVIYSDGLVEAHNPEGDMFGFPRLRTLLEMPVCGEDLIHCMLDDLRVFTGADWEQEDDVTFVTLERQPIEDSPRAMKVLSRFSIESQPGNERQAMERVAEIVIGLGMQSDRLAKLKTAVAEATMNAMEHGNRYQPDLAVDISVASSDEGLSVSIRDHGGGKDIIETDMPDLDAKLAGMQSPRGWGLFLIKNMVDEMRVSMDEKHHTVELIMGWKPANNKELNHE